MFFSSDREKGQARPRAAAEYSLTAMIDAGIEQCAIVISDRKSEIMRYFSDGKDFNISIAYLIPTLFGISYWENM